jgi:heptaprenyl diphosphate synthase
MELESLRVMIADEIQHTYLDKYIKKPVIDEEKLIILSSVMNHTTLSASKKKQYIMATMLVQIALDTHDLVSKVTSPDEGNVQKKQKQLHVLAGDYYSGLYYSLLAKVSDYDMIHVLASAIKEINEYKMKLYYLEVDSFQSFLHLVQKVESLLFVHVAQYVKESAIGNSIEAWLLANRLLREKQHVHDNGYSSLLDRWVGQSKTDTYATMAGKMDKVIEDTLWQMRQHLSQLPNHYYTILKEHISNRIRANAIKAKEG